MKKNNEPIDLSEMYLSEDRHIDSPSKNTRWVKMLRNFKLTGHNDFLNDRLPTILKQLEADFEMIDDQKGAIDRIRVFLADMQKEHGQKRYRQVFKGIRKKIDSFESQCEKEILYDATLLHPAVYSERGINLMIVELGDFPHSQKRIYELKSESHDPSGISKDHAYWLIDLVQKFRKLYFSIVKGQLFELDLLDLITELKDQLENINPEKRKEALRLLNCWLIDKKVEIGNNAMSQKIDELWKEISNQTEIDIPTNTNAIAGIIHDKPKLSESAQIEKAANLDFFKLFKENYENIEILIKALKNLDLINDKEVWDVEKCPEIGPVEDYLIDENWLINKKANHAEKLFQERFKLSIKRKVHRKKKEKPYLNRYRKIENEIKKLKIESK